MQIIQHGKYIVWFAASELVASDGLHFLPDLLDIYLNYGSHQCTNHLNSMEMLKNEPILVHLC